MDNLTSKDFNKAVRILERNNIPIKKQGFLLVKVYPKSYLGKYVKKYGLIKAQKKFGVYILWN